MVIRVESEVFESREGGWLPPSVSGAVADVTDKQEDLDVVSQVDAEAGTATDERVWTAERVNQAIQALAPGGGGGGDAWSDAVDADIIPDAGVGSLMEKPC